MAYKKFSLYVNPKTMPAFEALERIAERDGLSVSDLVCQGICEVAQQDAAKVSITEEAYGALGEGRVDVLVSVPVSGRRLWTAKR